MTQEQKQLLLKDLSGRICYRPKGVLLRTGFDDEEIEVIGYDGHFIDFFRKGDYDQASVDQVKLYLRPMSSMTEEEKKSYYKTLVYTPEGRPCMFEKSFDWLDANHFDYRGLIEKGLALEAPEGMYKN